MEKLNKVFLGGTCNNSSWRERLIPLLMCDYFNPVVPDWTEECQKREEYEKEKDLYQLYVITPLMKGVFSIAEVVQASNVDPTHTIFCVLYEDDGLEFEKAEAKSLKAVENLVQRNGAIVLHNLKEVAIYLNVFCTNCK